MISPANSKRNCLLLALIICRCLAFSHSAIDTSKVYKGAIEVDVVKNTDGISGIKAVFTIDASLTEIWGMLNDYNNYKSIYGGIDSLKILERDKSGILIEFWSDAVVKRIHFILYRNIQQTYRTITWKNAGGEIEYIRGSWEIYETSIPGKQLLVYQSYVKVKSTINTWLIKQGAKMKAETMARNLREWMMKNRKLYAVQ